MALLHSDSMVGREHWSQQRSRVVRRHSRHVHPDTTRCRNVIEQFPIINRNRDAGQAGDLAAKKRFDVLHRASVVVNAAQMLAVLVVLVRYVVH